MSLYLADAISNKTGNASKLILQTNEKINLRLTVIIIHGSDHSFLPHLCNVESTKDHNYKSNVPVPNCQCKSSMGTQVIDPPPLKKNNKKNNKKKKSPGKVKVQEDAQVLISVRYGLCWRSVHPIRWRCHWCQIHQKWHSLRESKPRRVVLRQPHGVKKKEVPQIPCYVTANTL